MTQHYPNLQNKLSIKIDTDQSAKDNNGGSYAANTFRFQNKVFK